MSEKLIDLTVATEIGYLLENYNTQFSNYELAQKLIEIAAQVYVDGMPDHVTKREARMTLFDFVNTGINKAF